MVELTYREKPGGPVVWAEEGGLLVSIQRVSDCKVEIAIVRDPGEVLARATVLDFRWDRLRAPLTKATPPERAP